MDRSADEPTTEGRRGVLIGKGVLHDLRCRYSPNFIVSLCRFDSTEARSLYRFMAPGV